MATVTLVTNIAGRFHYGEHASMDAAYCALSGTAGRHGWVVEGIDVDATEWTLARGGIVQGRAWIQPTEGQA
jgi:hypothetical protein